MPHSFLYSGNWSRYPVLKNKHVLLSHMCANIMPSMPWGGMVLVDHGSRVGDSLTNLISYILTIKFAEETICSSVEKASRPILASAG